MLNEWRSLYEKSQELHKQGLGSIRISRILGISRSTIAGWIYRGKKPTTAKRKLKRIESKGESIVSKKWGILRSVMSRELLVRKYYDQKLSEQKIAKEFGVSPRAIQYWMKKLGLKPRSKFEYCLKPNLSPSPTLAYILGVLEGDGYIQDKRSIELIVTSEQFAHSFFNSLKEIGLHPHIRKLEKVKGKLGKKLPWEVRAYSRVFVKWYEKTRKKITKCKVVKAFPLDFIRGFYESEGSFYRGVDLRWKKPYLRHRITIHNTDQQLLELVRKLLEKYCIKASIYKRKIIKWGKTRECFALSISRHKDVFKFLELVQPCIKNGN
jgi:intein-encoded DNA endonuclease-like protein